MPDESRPHRNLPEENTEALEIAHGLVAQRYPSVPSYEMKLAYALLSLEEQLRTAETTLAHAEAFIEHQDMSYRWAEWCEGRDPNPANDPDGPEAFEGTLMDPVVRFTSWIRRLVLQAVHDGGDPAGRGRSLPRYEGRMSKRKMVWEVVEARFYSERLEQLLAIGWEPFGVIPGDPPGQNDRVALRRFIESEDAMGEVFEPVRAAQSQDTSHEPPAA